MESHVSFVFMAEVLLAQEYYIAEYHDVRAKLLFGYKIIITS